MHEEDTGELGTIRSFAERWAAGTLRQADRVTEARGRALAIDRDYERMEDWSPTLAEVHQAFDDAWVEQHLLVVAAHQFDKWARRLIEVGSSVRAPLVPGSLATLRNSLEHLDEALFQRDLAVPDSTSTKKTWSLAALPGGGLSLGSDWREATLTAFGILDVDAILNECQAVMSDIFEERVAPHVDWYIQSLIDQRRGK